MMIIITISSSSTTTTTTTIVGIIGMPTMFMIPGRTCCPPLSSLV
jgi:hypothetical protein